MNPTSSHLLFQVGAGFLHPDTGKPAKKRTIAKTVHALFNLEEFVLARIAHGLIGPVRSIIIAVIALLLSGVALAFLPSEADVEGSRLPDGYASTQVQTTLDALDTSQQLPAFIVFARQDQGELTPSDIEAATSTVTSLKAPGAALAGPPLIVADNQAAALSTWTVQSEEVADSVKTLREQAPTEGLDVYITGPAGLATDISGVFEGANTRLLAVTAAVVALLLIITYRSPWLWIVPLLVVGIGDRIAVGLGVAAGNALGVPIDGSTTGIVSVLVFGAGTNYALLLISRYRDELRSTPDRYKAMRTAWRESLEAIIGAGGTVAVALATLGLSAFELTRGLGLAGVIGIVTAMFFALIVLPPALVIFGRRLFWPFVPKEGDVRSVDRHGIWSKTGALVAKRPAVIVTVSAIVLGIGALGLVGAKVGLPIEQQFLTTPQSVQGLEVLSRGFPAGSTEPVVITTPAGQGEETAERVEAFDFVASTQVKESGQVDIVEAVLESAPGTPESTEQVQAIRDQVQTTDVLVGGAVALDIDREAATAADLKVILPLIVLAVFALLVILLRALVAPVLLVVTVLATFAAATGISVWAFENIFNFAAVEASVPLLAFVFLVALGVDYNIFLVTRAKKEAQAWGTRPGMLRALSATGAVITSAGILLAAVFATLGVLPLIALAQIGIIVCLGVLIDTLLVRTVVVPAIVMLTGKNFWWPGMLSKAEEAIPDPAGCE